MRVRRRLHQWLRRAHTVTAANSVLAEYARQYSHNVHVVPMAIDLQQWQPLAHGGDKITIGWAGSPVNLPNLERLEPLLADILARFDQVELAVFCGQRPRLQCRYRYQPFVPGKEAAFVQQLDIGLLPLADDAFARGKSPIKAIQYIACGVPVVGNVMGASADILNADNSLAVQGEEEWRQALETLIQDADLRQRLGVAGRQRALQHHDITRVQQQLLSILTNL
jgi:glycosyltransferase involved in cell wall biosynthesis